MTPRRLPNLAPRGTGILPVISRLPLPTILFSLLFFTPRAQAQQPTPQPAITFTRDIAPLIYANCASCHHPGEAAPFNLLTYSDVRKRARQIVDVTQKHFMPPWLPNTGPAQPDFVGARTLSEPQLKLLAAWADTNCPEGNPADLPPTPAFATGWQSGTPDLVLESPAYTLASADRDVFRNFVIPIDFDKPRWIQSIELRPDNPKVTHHARLGVDSSNESVRRDAEDPEPGYAGMAWAQDPEGQLVIWAPGMLITPSSQGLAWRLYPKSALVLHTHMQPSGKPETVKFHIGIHFATEPPAINPVMLRIGATDIDIPANTKHHVVTDHYTLPIDVDVQTIFPHAHSLCSEIHVLATLPDGVTQPLINIDHFDENWHDMYRYRAPLHLPRGTRLTTTFAYDNTAENIRNRNSPPRRVVYGSNANDEMSDVYLQVTPAHPDQRAVLLEHWKQYDLQAQLAGTRKSLEIYPENALLQEGLATYYVALGQPAAAINILQSRISSGPPAVYPLVSLAMATLATGDATKSESEFRKALALDPEYPLAWFGLGQSLTAQKKPDAAEAAYRKTIDLAPGLADARLNLADLLIRKGNLTEAAALSSRALEVSPDNATIYLKLGEIAALQKNDTAALACYADAQRTAPYTHPPKVLLALNHAAAGDTTAALALLKQAQLESPTYPIPPLILGQLASRQNQLEPARAYFTTAAALPLPENWPDSHKRRFLILLHTERLRLAQQLQDEPLARDALTQWLKQDPQNPKLLEMQKQLTPPPTK